MPRRPPALRALASLCPSRSPHPLPLAGHPWRASLALLCPGQPRAPDSPRYGLEVHSIAKAIARAIAPSVGRWRGQHRVALARDMPTLMKVRPRVHVGAVPSASPIPVLPASCFPLYGVLCVLHGCTSVRFGYNSQMSRIPRNLEFFEH